MEPPRETRSVKTGITDATNTEVIEGLREGEQVQIKSTTSTSSTSSGLGGPGGGPGMGGFAAMIELKNIVKSYPMGKRELKVLQGVKS